MINKKSLLAGFVAVATTFASFAGGADFANAQRKKTLVIYSGRSEKLIGPLIKQARKDLNMDIKVRYGKTAQLAIALLEEGRNSRADLFFAQDAGALGALERRNRTVRISSNILEKVPYRYRSPWGNWMGISGRARVIDYNTKLVNKRQLPKSIWELTQRKWRGKVAWAPTNGSFQSFVTGMRVVYGDKKTLQWLRAMKANGARKYPKNSAIVKALGRGEVHLGLVNHYYLNRFKKKNPRFPVAHHSTRNDVGAMINVAGVAIMRTTDQKSDAQRFINYLLSRKSQRFFAQKTTEYPLRKGMRSPKGQIPLNKLNAPRINLTNLHSLEKTLKLMQKAGVL
ncbi:ABC transporter, ferric iron-binding periplasmic protein [Calothrix parasitica NIES-267]|uniref:ABC transporter, ferric iron-binding periplasmic protein n=1 Tax=Calothrix parasitica NIES-267 TaxID=1973488 RepID=A0A1Z4LJM2_9CYAN|nr:ABC transporter, ferric iron-binding periplasmic protein [Calothrix parasitica NIES-267]